MNPLKVLSFCVREGLSGPRVERCPEPAVMTGRESVDAFHAEGSTLGSLAGVYRLNARAVSRFLPSGGAVVDLGSGSAQFLIHLARCRPDKRITGFDLSEAMVELGTRAVEDAGLGGRLNLVLGDMTTLGDLVPAPVDVVTSVFSLHHLPAPEGLRRCLEGITQIRHRTGCGVWVFDHSRPRHPRTAADLSEIFTTDASPAFQRDSRNSLRAAWSFAELSEALDEVDIGTFHHVTSSLRLPWQAHWLEPVGWTSRKGEPLWRRLPLSPRAARDFGGLRLALWRVPLDDERGAR